MRLCWCSYVYWTLMYFCAFWPVFLLVLLSSFVHLFEGVTDIGNIQQLCNRLDLLKTSLMGAFHSSLHAGHIQPPIFPQVIEQDFSASGLSGISDQIILCCGACSVHHRVFRSLTDSYTLKINDTLLRPSKMCPDIFQSGANLPLGEKNCPRGWWSYKMEKVFIPESLLGSPIKKLRDFWDLSVTLSNAILSLSLLYNLRFFCLIY